MRKYFIKLAGMSMVLFCLSASAEKQPNIVVILADDMGWGDVGYHGFDDIRTPNIDRLAKSGTWFEQGYACSSICGPSRAGLMTGVYQQRFGFYGNFKESHVPLNQPMLSEMLKEQGYATGMVGKWHLGEKTGKPNDRGWDFFYGFHHGSHDYDYSDAEEGGHPWQSPIYRNRTPEPPIQDSNGYLTEMFTKEAVGFIVDAPADQPFFLYLAYNAVHHPWVVPQPYIDRVQNLSAHDERKLFAGMVLAMDDGVGAVMDALRKKGMLKNTLVFFISDNGTPRGQGLKPPLKKKRGETTMSSPGPFNGFKGETYEGGIRIPFVAQWPGRIPAGATYGHPVSNLDVAATVMARCGVAKPPSGHPFDGVDLFPFLTGQKSGQPHEILYWRRDNDFAVRKGDWKLAYNDSVDGTGPDREELFNLAVDKEERNDVIQQHPEKARELRKLFDGWDTSLPPAADWMPLFINRRK
jgi:arylsulfatase A-like enzyme